MEQLDFLIQTGDRPPNQETLQAKAESGVILLANAEVQRGGGEFVTSRIRVDFDLQVPQTCDIQFKGIDPGDIIELIDRNRNH